MATQTAAGLAPVKVLRDMIADPFSSFRQRFNRLYGETVVPFAPFNEEDWSIASWSPACDIYETDSEIVVKTELPGVKRENVHVALENNVLTIRGERKFKEETKKENYHRIESNYGEFMRKLCSSRFHRCEQDRRGIQRWPALRDAWQARRVETKAGRSESEIALC